MIQSVPSLTALLHSVTQVNAPRGYSSENTQLVVCMQKLFISVYTVYILTS